MWFTLPNSGWLARPFEEEWIGFTPSEVDLVYAQDSPRRLPLDYDVFILGLDYLGPTAIFSFLNEHVKADGYSWYDDPYNMVLNQKGKVLLVPTGYKHYEEWTGNKNIQFGGPGGDYQDKDYFGVLAGQNPSDKPEITLCTYDTIYGAAIEEQKDSHAGIYDIIVNSISEDSWGGGCIGNRSLEARFVGVLVNDITWLASGGFGAITAFSFGDGQGPAMYFDCAFIGDMYHPNEPTASTIGFATTGGPHTHFGYLYNCTVSGDAQIPFAALMAGGDPQVFPPPTVFAYNCVAHVPNPLDLTGLPCYMIYRWIDDVLPQPEPWRFVFRNLIGDAIINTADGFLANDMVYAVWPTPPGGLQLYYVTIEWDNGGVWEQFYDSRSEGLRGILPFNTTYSVGFFDWNNEFWATAGVWAGCFIKIACSDQDPVFPLSPDGFRLTNENGLGVPSKAMWAYHPIGTGLGPIDIIFKTASNQVINTVEGVGEGEWAFALYDGAIEPYVDYNDETGPAPDYSYKIIVAQGGTELGELPWGEAGSSGWWWDTVKRPLVIHYFNSDVEDTIFRVWDQGCHEPFPLSWPDYEEDTARQLPLDYNTYILHNHFSSLQAFNYYKLQNDMVTNQKGELLLLIDSVVHEETVASGEDGIQLGPLNAWFNNADYWGGVISEFMDYGTKATIQVTNDVPKGVELYAVHMLGLTRMYDCRIGLSSICDMVGVYPAVVHHAVPAAPVNVGCTNADIICPNIPPSGSESPIMVIVFLPDGHGGCVECAIDHDVNIDIGDGVLVGFLLGNHWTGNYAFNCVANNIFAGFVAQDGMDEVGGNAISTVINCCAQECTGANFIQMIDMGGTGRFNSTYYPLYNANDAALDFHPGNHYVLRTNDGNGFDMMLHPNPLRRFSDTIFGHLWDTWDRAANDASEIVVPSLVQYRRPYLSERVLMCLSERVAHWLSTRNQKDVANVTIIGGKPPKK